MSRSGTRGARGFVAAVVVAVLGLAPGRAGAQPEVEDVEELVEPAAPTAASYQPDRRRSRSYLIPGVELLAMNAIGNVGARIAGAPWADVTPSTMWHNVTHSWVYDNDLFSVNQLAHPYGGALFYGAARSSGHGFWVSAAYGFAGSLFWEALMENEPPSINDQVTTSIAGAFLGEVMHRWGRAVRQGGGERPSVSQRVLAAVIDPVGAANEAMFGDRWLAAPPPRLHAFLAAGGNLALDDSASGPVHIELAVSHGLPSDPRFVPRVPFHHFDLRGQLDLGREGATGYLDVRGTILGATLGEGRRRAVWGLYGTYSYWDAEGVRAGAIGVGPGIALHAALGEKSFLAATGVVAAVPWGAAGGTGDVEGVRDYHHGPGIAEVVELKLGRPGEGVLRLSARAIQIAGKLRGDATETVVVTSGGLMVALGRHHAVGIDVVYSARSAQFSDAAMDALDQAAQVRVMYAVMSDSDFGGPAR